MFLKRWVVNSQILSKLVYLHCVKDSIYVVVIFQTGQSNVEVRGVSGKHNPLHLIGQKLSVQREWQVLTKKSLQNAGSCEYLTCITELQICVVSELKSLLPFYLPIYFLALANVASASSEVVLLHVTLPR